MTIGCWVLLAIGIIAIVVAIAIACYFFYDGEPGIGIAAIVIGIIVGAAMIVGPIIYSNTEAGKRALKDQKSNFGEGIQRTIRVYDVDGELVEEYKGKFDVETDNANYILFDDENGKRHIIYQGVSTVLIDED